METLKIILIVYVVVCVLLFFFQEKLIFFPEKLDKDFKFTFTGSFEEIKIETPDDKLLHGLLFTADSSRGLIFYLHGNAGSVNSWGDVAKRYTDLDYDVFILDYRGYGKSEGSIHSQAQFYSDVQLAYDEMKKRYEESKIVVLGYSLGTGAATKIAATNQPRLLILQAPYYSVTNMMRRNYPIIPTFILKYKFETHKSIIACKMPVIIFHGTKDAVIYYGSSLKLKKLMKDADTLITLKDHGHNEITDNAEYISALTKILQ